jgi:cytochrome c-type biogenesis protein CcmE
MTRKQRRLVLIGGSLGVLALAAVLVLSALKDSIVFFNSPSDVVEKNLQPGSRIRLGGLVKPGSLERGEQLAVRFEVTDRIRRRVQSRFHSRQARREIHAQGGGRRAEEAGPLERGGRGKEMIAK